MVNYGYPREVVLTEVGLRDGLQMEGDILPTEAKAEAAADLAAAGLREVQAASFVHPGRVPQMADAEDLLSRIGALPGARVIALVLNDRGLARAVRAGVECVEISFSASDAHSRENAGMGAERAFMKAKLMIREAKAAGMGVRAGIQCVFGFARPGDIDPAAVLSMAGELAAERPDSLILADTTGMAAPNAVTRLLETLAPRLEGVEPGLHLHDTRGLGLVNVMAGLAAGVARFDTAMGGMGGCPFVSGASGNIATEDTAYLLERLGIKTGVDIGRVAAVTARMEAFFKKRYPGKMHRLASAAEGRGED